MSNDPDLLEQPCPDCFGNGFALVDPEDDEAQSGYVDCRECDGEGKR